MKKMKRTIVNARLWATGWAILRYLPRAFRLKPVNGLDFYAPETIAKFIQRVKSVRPDSIRQWGTMSPAQMLHHLNLAIGAPLGYYELQDESYFLSRTLFKWITVDWFPEEPVGLQLPLSFVIPHDQQFNFEYEQGQLVKIITAAGQAQPDDFGPHPYYGKMSYKEWGKLFIIHIDYHMRQFSA